MFQESMKEMKYIFVVNDQEFECFSSGSGAESYQEVYVGTGRCIHFVGSVSRDCRPTL